MKNKKSIVFFLSIVCAFFVGITAFKVANSQPVEAQAITVSIEGSNALNYETSVSTSETPSEIIAQPRTTEPSQWAMDFKTIIDTPIGWGTMTVGGLIILILTIFARSSVGKKTFNKYKEENSKIVSQFATLQKEIELKQKEIEKLINLISEIQKELSGLYKLVRSSTRNVKVIKEIEFKEKELKELETKVESLKGGVNNGK